MFRLDFPGIRGSLFISAQVLNRYPKNINRSLQEKTKECIKEKVTIQLQKGENKYGSIY